MRLTIEEKATQHTEICTACAWSNGELYTCSDDMQILKWSQEGEMLGACACSITCFGRLVARTAGRERERETKREEKGWSVGSVRLLCFYRK